MKGIKDIKKTIKSVKLNCTNQEGKQLILLTSRNRAKMNNTEQFIMIDCCDDAIKPSDNEISEH